MITASSGTTGNPCVVVLELTIALEVNNWKLKHNALMYFNPHARDSRDIEPTEFDTARILKFLPPKIDLKQVSNPCFEFFKSSDYNDS